MNTEIPQNSFQARINIISNEGGAFLLCNWVRFVFIHYEVDTKLLQDAVPFELDLFEGKAYVSLVAFTLEDFRFAQNGIVQRLAAVLPVRTHRYFNVRTYIKSRLSGYKSNNCNWLSFSVLSLMSSFSVSG